ncbi:hypothetical protein [Streptomyces sp. NPDC127098]|uniref:hypothetical protein n=1 Tax=Streptomyces sp. NPDC127098 TaxID=3347137 RepID=UPI003648076A
MLTRTVYEDSHLSRWLRVRTFAVPPTVIETATARRRAGDWAGACAAAGVDVELTPRAVARRHGRVLADQVRADLRRLAPDLLRWHLPRVAPDGLLRPGLTVPLARYVTDGRDSRAAPHLVVRTPPAWAAGGQRLSLALWHGAEPEPAARQHPHPRPSRRFRLDLHRHLWDAERAHELRTRAGADRQPEEGRLVPDPAERWPAEARILLRAEGRSSGSVAARCAARQWLVLDLDGDAPPGVRITTKPTDGRGATLPMLPEAAIQPLPDLELVRAGLIEVDRLHPLVASALAPDRPPSDPPPADPARQARLVECRGAGHRIGLVDGTLVPLDHDPDEIRREELLAALGGTPLPCLGAVHEAHRRPDQLAAVRERLAHGDTAGALAVVEGLLGPEALLPGGALRDELEAAARRRVDHGLFRAGLAGPGPGRVLLPGRPRPDGHRTRPRHAR